MMETKLVLLGTGTPNACPNASGPSSAVVVGDRAYLVDFGPDRKSTRLTRPAIRISFLHRGCWNARSR